MRIAPAPVPRLYRPERSEFLRFVERAEPVVLEGVLDDWRAPDTWTFDRLETVIGGASVLVQTRFGSGARDFDYRNVAFDTVIDSIQNDGRDYLISSPVVGRFPGLLRDFRVPEYVGPRSLPPIAFVGPRGSFTPLHYDLHHGLLAQVRGRKDVTVVQFRRRDVLGRWELRGPARLSEPLFDETVHACGAVPRKRWECTLAPRELLYVPSCRHHCARSVDPSISLSFTWHTRPMRLFSKLCKFLARV